jgi:hypothetical protein
MVRPWSGVEKDAGGGPPLLVEVRVVVGTGLATFTRMIEAQGGEPRVNQTITPGFPTAPDSDVLRAERAGFPDREEGRGGWPREQCARRGPRQGWVTLSDHAVPGIS